MSATLQSTFGTISAGRSHRVLYQAEMRHTSDPVDELTTGAQGAPSAAAVFRLRPSENADAHPYVPPVFVPPGQNLICSGADLVDQPARLRPLRPRESEHEHDARQSLADKAARKPKNDDRMDLDHRPRSPSPTPDDALEQQRQSIWSKDAHQSFHAMVTADGYVNRYRLHMKKKQRLIHYLEQPDVEPLLCDGSKDHQTKYQAENWIWREGQLFRKPESGRVAALRRHLDYDEAWDVLTREHLRSGHLGRDKLRKRLEQRYIGYTLQELMFVLKNCARCGGPQRLANDERDEAGQSALDWSEGDKGLNGDETAPSSARIIGPFGRPQASNAMYP